jgi:hypothetical protein
LREKLELEMMAACDWLTEPAAAALAAAAAEERKLQEAAKNLWEAGSKQQLGQDPAAAAAAAGGGEGAAGSSGAAGGSSNGGSVDDKAASSQLVMPSALQQRVTKELKIHKHQVSRCTDRPGAGGFQIGRLEDGCVLIMQWPMLGANTSACRGS